MMDFTRNNVFSNSQDYDYSDCLPKWAKDEGLYNVDECNRICKQSFFKKVFGFLG